MFFRGAENFHYTGELLLLVFAGEDGVAGFELGEDAAEGPHVDWKTVRHAKDHFRRAVEAGLDVCVHWRGQ